MKNDKQKNAENTAVSELQKLLDCLRLLYPEELNRLEHGETVADIAGRLLKIKSVTETDAEEDDDYPRRKTIGTAVDSIVQGLTVLSDNEKIAAVKAGLAIFNLQLPQSNRPKIAYTEALKQIIADRTGMIRALEGRDYFNVLGYFAHAYLMSTLAEGTPDFTRDLMLELAEEFKKTLENSNQKKEE